MKCKICSLMCFIQSLCWRSSDRIKLMTFIKTVLKAQICFYKLKVLLFFYFYFVLLWNMTWWNRRQFELDWTGLNWISAQGPGGNHITNKDLRWSQFVFCLKRCQRKLYFQLNHSLSVSVSECDYHQCFHQYADKQHRSADRLETIYQWCQCSL